MDAAAKQQIVERVKQANNILVTVSSDPTVDQLASCIGLTLLFNKMGKHATAIFSGKVPSTIEFLQPQKTIETNTDSLQDFIISLDKEKADKLRYKVEDQVVKIFITPYKTSISERDLVFSKGDFNVEVVIALGISDKSQIDAAITAHGRILHDATVVALSAGQTKTAVGQINWQEPTASSLSEMIVSISEAFGGGLIDNQMATAFLTGIVAETDRFSNAKTTPKVMTMSAQLMAAGANQQLIASKLEQEVEIQTKRPIAKKPIAEQKLTPAGDPEAELDDGTLNIDHNQKKATDTSVDPEEIHIDEHGNIKTAADLAPPPPPEAALQEELAQPEPEQAPTTPTPPVPAAPAQPAVPEPPMPGPHALLSKEAPALTSPFSATTETEWRDPYNSVAIDPLNNAAPAPEAFEQRAETVQPPAEAQTPTPKLAEPGSVDSARDAVASALSAAPFDPAGDPVAALNATPVDLSQNDATPQPAPPDEQTAPPPFPPPLEPTAGAVIPSPPANGNSA